MRVPEQIVDILPVADSKGTTRDYRIREWAMEHFADCMSNQQPKDGRRPVAQYEASHNNVEDGNANVKNPCQPSTKNQNGNVGGDGHGDMPTSGAGDTDNEINADQEIQKPPKVHSRKRRKLVYTRDKTARLAKHSLNFVLVIPTDVTLSMAKGFHNLPKLYHDTTVQKIPTVRGIGSGLGAAQKVSRQSMSRHALLVQSHSSIVGACAGILSRCDWTRHSACSRFSAVRWQRVSQRNWKGPRWGHFQTSCRYVLLLFFFGGTRILNRLP